jgi:hypothetical protein
MRHQKSQLAPIDATPGNWSLCVDSPARRSRLVCDEAPTQFASEMYQSPALAGAPLRVQDRIGGRWKGNAPNKEVMLILNRSSGSGGYPANWERKFDWH